MGAAFHDKIQTVQQELLKEAGNVFAGDLYGYAASAAAAELLWHWRGGNPLAAVTKASDVDAVIEGTTGMESIAVTRLARFPLRISRGDAIAIANRGGDYCVHAAVRAPENFFYTACGRKMISVNFHPAENQVDCRLCLRIRRGRS